jgi:membrane-associated protease RseP (regulator of RpoE activity)
MRAAGEVIPMNKTVLAVILSVVAGFAAGVWTTSAPQSGGEQVSDPAQYFDAGAPATDRLDVLERIVAEERDARLVLEEQLQALLADFDRIDNPDMQELLSMAAENRAEMEAARTQRSARVESRRGMRDYSQIRTTQLVAGGFTETRAKQILALEDEVRMQALEAEYEAQRNGEAFDRWNQSYDAQAAFRESLGDADYEQYLQARGGESTVTVREVIGSSPANRAGMQPGDRILSYDGDRVFNMFELKSKAFAGSPGEDVIVDIERDGQRMQLVLPRGPIGITGSGAGMSFRNPFGGG